MWGHVTLVGGTWQKLCPHGVETGSSNRSRQMEQVNSCSEKSSEEVAASAMAPNTLLPAYRLWLWSTTDMVRAVVVLVG